MAARSNGKDGEQSRLAEARLLLAQALALLDGVRPLPAAATLDLALHQLDRAINASGARAEAGATDTPGKPRRSSK